MYVDVKIVELYAAPTNCCSLPFALQFNTNLRLNTEMLNFLTFENFSSQSQFTLGGPQMKTFMDCILFDQLMVNLINTGRGKLIVFSVNGQWIK